MTDYRQIVLVYRTKNYETLTARVAVDADIAQKAKNNDKNAINNILIESKKHFMKKLGLEQMFIDTEDCTIEFLDIFVDKKTNKQVYPQLSLLD